jgi:ribosomal protein S21
MVRVADDRDHAVSRISLSADSAVVHLEPYDSVETMLRRFKKSCEAADIFNEIKKRLHHVPRGARRRAKAKRAAKRRARAAQRQRENAGLDWKPEPTRGATADGKR